MVGAIIGAASVFAGIAVITAQVSNSSRGANGLAGAAVAGFFVVSAVGNSSTDSVLIWVTPFGWAEQVQAFADQHPLLVLMSFGCAFLLAGIGILISARRDVGSSLVAPRLSRAQARPYLSSPLGLAWRVDRAWLIWWLVGAALLGAIEGSILDSSLTAMTQNPSLLKLIEALGGQGNLASAFTVLMVGLFALAACGFSIATVGRLISAEASGQAELELSSPMARTTWACGHLVVAYLGAAAIVIVGSLALGLVYGTSIHDITTSVGHAVGAGLITVPAVWLVVGVAVLALGLRPHWFFLGWVALGWCVVAGWFGAVLGLPEWLLKTSPFGHLPLWPSSPMSWVPVLILTFLSLLLLVVAGRGLTRRDLPN
jgi:ABC-2 type transport system permease protein